MERTATVSLQRLIVESATVGGAQETGILVGHLLAGDIQDVSVAGILTPTSARSGGIAGNASAGATIRRVQCHVTILGDASAVGGCFGSSEATISEAFSNSYVQGRYWIGGLAGMSSEKGTILNSTANFSGGYTTTSYAATGGLVGLVRGRVTGSTASIYMMKTIAGVDRVGSLIGQLDAEQFFEAQCQVSNSYGTGYIDIKPCAECGGLIGKVDECSLNTSYADTLVKKNAGSDSNANLIGNNNLGTYNQGLGVRSLNADWGIGGAGVSGLFTRMREEMSRQDLLSQYHGFDFVNTWKIPSSGGSAKLKWEQDNLDFDFKLDNGWKIGKSNENAFTISGVCPTPGQSIMIRGAINTTSTCNAGSWSVTLDLSSLADGPVPISIMLADEWNTNPERPIGVGRIFFKETSDCVADVNGALLGYKGTGASGDPYVLCTPAHHQTLVGDNQYLNTFIKLGDHIDLSSETPNHGVLGANSGSAFVGDFDGNGFSIANFQHLASGTDHIGFFGYVGTAGVIKNLILINPRVEGAANVGAVVGEFAGTTLDLVRIYGEPDGNVDVSGSENVGGAVGYHNAASGVFIEQIFVENIRVEKLSNTTSGNIGGLVGLSNRNVKNSYAIGASVIDNGGYENTGGLIGKLAMNGKVSASYSTNDVSGAGMVGGLIGFITDSAGHEVRWTFATGDVSGYDDVGGAIGRSEGSTNTITITDIYATGQVVGTSGSNDIGGLLGYSQANVSRCYAIGDVSTTESVSVGGLAGNIAYRNVSSCFSSGTVSETGTTVGKIGGFNGKFQSISSISNSYTLSKVNWNGLSLVGGWLADVSGVMSAMTCTDLFYGYDAGLPGFGTGFAQGSGAATDPDNCVDGTHISPATEADLKNKSFYPGSWNFSSNWLILDGQTYPIPLWYSFIH